jgi:hypothetical protein
LAKAKSVKIPSPHKIAVSQVRFGKRLPDTVRFRAFKARGFQNYLVRRIVPVDGIKRLKRAKQGFVSGPHGPAKVQVSLVDTRPAVVRDQTQGRARRSFERCHSSMLVKSFDRAQVTVEADLDISRDGVRPAQAFEGEAAT